MLTAKDVEKEARRASAAGDHVRAAAAWSVAADMHAATVTKLTHKRRKTK